MPLAPLAFGYLILFLAVLLGASFFGSTDLSPAQVWTSFSGGGAEFQVWFDLRFRRLVYAGAVGALLALSGTVFQAVLRNPLAEPYILGVSGAAALGAVGVRYVLPIGGGVLAADALLYAGPLAGAIAGIVLLLGLARYASIYDPPSLILAGAVLNAVFGALILLFYALAPERQVVSSLIWLMGNINSQALLGTPHLPGALAFLAAGSILFSAVARNLDLLSLGEEEAADLGLNPRGFRIAMLVAASLLAGVVVAGAGHIGFIGLVVPHILRLIHGPGHRRLLPLSMFGGAIFLMLCDTVARTAFLPHQIPIGAVTALVGGPFFLFLLGRGKAAGVV